MTEAESLQAEVERLRTEVEGYRQREFADMKSALALARQDAEHYRSEAYRNADAAKKIAAEYERKVTALETKLETITSINARRSINN